MSHPKISPSLLVFLSDIAENNNREWFEKNKPRYQEEYKKLIEFADALLDEMNGHDNIETPSGKKSLYRIYRDVRFSKNKLPYKINLGGGFSRATKQLRGGYYYHIQPGESFVAGGFWAPNSGDLKLIRDDIATDDSELRAILSDPVFVETFGELKGNGVKTAPRGFAKDHPAIDLIRKKQFYIMHSFTDNEVLAGDFLDKMVDTFKKMRPFFDYMSYVLTTDANGVPLYED